MSEKFDLAVIGGGAAGLMAAGRASELGLKTAVIVKGAAGAKLLITGKGRCNVTNNCEVRAFVSNIVSNPRFLYGALSEFSPADTMEFFQSRSVPLKTERGARVYPESDRAADILGALQKYSSGCRVFSDRATEIELLDGKVIAVRCESRRIECRAALLAAGGMSFPGTGSDGDGFRLAEKVGHTIVEPAAALCPIECADSACKEAQGLSLKNVELVCRTETGKKLFRERGELLFTHFGISGPMALTLSSYINRMDMSGLELYIDFKPALDEQALDARLLRDFSGNLNREFRNSLDALLPKSIIPEMVRRSGVQPDKRVNSVTAAERKALLETIKHFSLRPLRLRPIAEAIVTAGGVAVREIDAKTLASKLVGGLYFAGEVMDVDALTGGFNLQIAFSSAVRAANAAAAALSADRKK